MKSKKILRTVYTVQKINKNDKTYGPIHNSYDGNETVCGKQLNEHWTILTNAFDGESNCSKCYDYHFMLHEKAKKNKKNIPPVGFYED